MFDLFMDRQLEFGEHGLAEECGPHQFERLAQIEELFRIAFGMRDHVVAEQHFIGDRSGFGGESGIIRFLERLRIMRQKGVNRMSPLVHEGGERIVVVVIVEV